MSNIDQHINLFCFYIMCQNTMHYMPFLDSVSEIVRIEPVIIV